MSYDFSGLSVCAEGGDCLKAAELFCEEIEMRTGKTPVINSGTLPLR